MPRKVVSWLAMPSGDGASHSRNSTPTLTQDSVLDLCASATQLAQALTTTGNTSARGAKLITADPRLAQHGYHRRAWPGDQDAGPPVRSPSAIGRWHQPPTHVRLRRSPPTSGWRAVRPTRSSRGRVIAGPWQAQASSDQSLISHWIWLTIRRSLQAKGRKSKGRVCVKYV